MQTRLAGGTGSHSAVVSLMLTGWPCYRGTVWTWNWVTFCDPVTLFYNELQMSTYVADKRLQWARGLPVFIAVWRLHASGK